jgi:hypothetical protein
MKSLSRSTPITTAFVAEPSRTAPSATASAWVNPAQAVLTSMVAGAGMPSWRATRAAMLGLRSVAVQVATTTRSTASATMPAWRRAAAAASAAIRSRGSSGPAIRRSRMPTRLRIHSSLVSTIVARSWLVSTFAGW